MKLRKSIRCMRGLLIGLLAMFMQFHGTAQRTLRYDSAAIELRSFATEKLSAYKKDEAFRYDKILEPPVSIWDRFWSWFWDKIGQLFDSKTGGNILNWAIILLAVGLLVFFIIKINGMTDGRLFGMKNKSGGLGYSTADEDIHTIDFNAAIQRAVDEKNFRLAVRLLYLQSLKKLTDQGKINWQINKTNLTYWQELSGMPYQQQFFELTRQFENNWYGNWPASEPEFVTLRQTFSEFNKQF